MSFNLQIICLSNYSIDFRLSSSSMKLCSKLIIMIRYNRMIWSNFYEYFNSKFISLIIITLNYTNFNKSLIKSLSYLVCAFQVSTKWKRWKQSNTNQFCYNESTTNIDTIMFNKWCSIAFLVSGWFGRGANIMPRLVPNWLSIIMVWRYNLINTILCAGRCI